MFSNMQVVQHEEQEFILTFGQYAPPLAIGRPEEQKIMAPHVPVKTVARIGMTPDRLKRFIDILKSNYDKWTEKQRG